ncbi:hypothetical protein AKJ66_00110 [candidate division MSBL1 archaeon SCGC-AAA259E22]|uniref:HTH tetR-type domain-containing protein n=1 Tax=candidate division MSBL1 archaeon SCGC-AAA259E22 TaxID=1698265 RepID=A0A133UIG4_9EURY|nr:hypothetical protein AKJ66_00110 [candidate division MSBL1 archaeon SCGC-AAA259E22]
MSENTKGTILGSAFDLFKEKSLNEATIEDVAEEAGVSKGAVFHYFDSKSELAVKCLKRAPKLQ